MIWGWGGVWAFPGWVVQPRWQGTEGHFLLGNEALTLWPDWKMWHQRGGSKGERQTEGIWHLSWVANFPETGIVSHFPSYPLPIQGSDHYAPGRPSSLPHAGTMQSPTSASSLPQPFLDLQPTEVSGLSKVQICDASSLLELSQLLPLW